MLTKIFAPFAKTFLIPIVAFLHLAGYQLAPVTPVIQAGTVPQYVAAAPTTLYGSGINSTQTSIELSSLTLPDGVTPITTNQLVGGVSGIGSDFYVTIEPASPTKETVSCTAVTQNVNGTAMLTGCIRGLNFTYPYTASTTLAISHSGGVPVVLSNSPQLYNDIIQYVASSSASGAADASTIAKGLVAVATGQQAASTTPIGGGVTSAALALTTTISTSSSPGIGNWIPVTVNGTINNNFISTSTLFATGTPYFATSTIIGSNPAFAIGKTVIVASTTGVGSTTIPAGIPWVCSIVTGPGGIGGSSNGSDNAGAGGGGGGTAEKCFAVGSTSTSTILNYTIGTSGTSTTMTATTTNGLITLTGGTGNNGTSNALPASGGGGGTASGGTLNITGGLGIFGLCWTTSACVGGYGGSSIYGGTGAYGTGGSGAAAGSGSGAQGQQGIIIIYY